ncbi:MAG: hypothetical protein IT281_05960 [Ignavibacteria bacterium]|nr:hypothetical protein [Ignavibacteria bacterium]MCC7159061.1 hypothetical protein [Ignavibacteria bacterium]
MPENFITDNWLYFTISIALYVYLILLFLIKFNSAVLNYYNRLKESISNATRSQKTAANILEFVDHRIYSPLKRGLSVSIEFLSNISGVNRLFEKFAYSGEKFIFSESADYAALLIRKVYGLNYRTMLIITSAGIVLFYFILTIF